MSHFSLLFRSWLLVVLFIASSRSELPRSYSSRFFDVHFIHTGLEPHLVSVHTTHTQAAS